MQNFDTKDANFRILRLSELRRGSGHGDRGWSVVPPVTNSPEPFAIRYNPA